LCILAAVRARLWRYGGGILTDSPNTMVNSWPPMMGGLLLFPGMLDSSGVKVPLLQFP